MKQFPQPQGFVCFCEVSENSDFSGIPHYQATFFVLEMYGKGFKKYTLFYVTSLWLAYYLFFDFFMVIIVYLIYFNY